MGWGNTSQTASNKRTEVRIRLLTERRDELLRQRAEHERMLAELGAELTKEVLWRRRLERERDLWGAEIAPWLADIAAERKRAHAKHGDTSMESSPAHDPTGRRYRILCEEVGEVAREFNDAEHEQRPVDLGRLRKELIQAAAMAGAWADACAAAVGVDSPPTDQPAKCAHSGQHHDDGNCWHPFTDHHRVDSSCRQISERGYVGPAVPVQDAPTEEKRPEIVVLCGSTRFKDAFYGEGKRLSLEGKIVLTVSDLDPHPENRNRNVAIDAGLKQRLDDLHKRKIDLADRVLILDVGGYIGDSTRGEIEYAERHGKPIDYYSSAAALVGDQPTEQAKQ